MDSFLMRHSFPQATAVLTYNEPMLQFDFAMAEIVFESES